MKALYILFIFSPLIFFAQVGINTTSPNAQLEIISTNTATPTNTDGILIPRINAFPVTPPTANQHSMLVYLTTTSGAHNPGFYYWDNAVTNSWVSLDKHRVNDLMDGKSDMDGSNNGSSIFLGIGAGTLDDKTDNRNIGIGYNSLNKNTSGDRNTASGYFSLQDNTTGERNTANGASALRRNTTGNKNTAIGYYALLHNDTGERNTANGVCALKENTTGAYNTANGTNALKENTTGSYNTANGTNAFYSGTNYQNSTALGYGTAINASNQIRLGNSDVTSIGGYAGWTNISDGRFKTNIKEDIVGIEFIKKLRPVSYNLNIAAIAKFNKTPEEFRLLEAQQVKAAEIQTGFIAQEVEQAAKSVGFNFHGVDKPQNDESHYGLRYAEFVVPLVKATQEQQAIIEHQENEIKELKRRILQIEQTVSTKSSFSQE